MHGSRVIIFRRVCIVVIVVKLSSSSPNYLERRDCEPLSMQSLAHVIIQLGYSDVQRSQVYIE